MEKKKSKKFRIILSVVALIEVLVLAAGITFSWAEGGNQAKINANEIMVTAGSSLTMMQDGKVSSSITIPMCNLDEASSKDGRNFFFPMENNENNQTATMTFREGTPQDENKKYVSLDFELIAGDTATDVFLGSGTIIECSNSAVINALRMSFSTNDNTDPIVFKPNQMPGITANYNPVTAISNTGLASTSAATTEAYGDFYYRGSNSNPLFHLDKNQTKHITLSIWLEGTEFSIDEVANKDLNIYVDFSTQVDEIVKYNFVDNTHGYGGAGGVSPEYWITNKEDGGKYETMMYVFDKQTQRYYLMQKSDSYSTNHTWIAYVPNTITNFSFRRYSIDIDEWWNEWTASMSSITTDKNGERTYVAICGTSNGATGSNLTPCGGYWKDSNGTYRIYFERSDSNWGNTIRCYAWKSSGSAASSTGEWPGKAMTWSHTSESGNSVYYIDLYETDNITGIQFNNGNNSTVSELTNKDYFFNGFVHWYESSTSNGVYLYTGTANSKIFS